MQHHRSCPGISRRILLLSLIVATGYFPVGCAAETPVYDANIAASLEEEQANEEPGSSSWAEPPKSAPSDALFNPDHMLQVSIEMDPEDWETLRNTTRDVADILLGEDCLSKPPDKIFDFFPARVTVDGVIVEHVGVRKKGFFGSLNKTRPALKIKFSEYEEEQSLHGMERMTLNNNHQDPARITTCLSYGVFAAANYPAPRCNFAKVQVNGEDLGIYTHVESIKKPYLRRHFHDDDGNLYEGARSDFRPEWRGTFEKKTNKTANDWRDMDAAIVALQSKGGEAIQKIELVFDVESYLTFWALEVLVAHRDGQSGNLNNFYIYQDPDRDRFVFLPWGMNRTFASPRTHHLLEHSPVSVLANSILANRLYQWPHSRARYLERLKELLDTVWDENHLLDEVDRMVALILPHASEEAQAEIKGNVAMTREFITRQRDAILGELDYGAPPWPTELWAPPCWRLEGELSASFETTWGSMGSDTPMDEGAVVFSTLIDRAVPVEFIAAGATIGQESELPNYQEALTCFEQKCGEFLTDCLDNPLCADYLACAHYCGSDDGCATTCTEQAASLIPGVLADLFGCAVPAGCYEGMANGPVVLSLYVLVEDDVREIFTFSLDPDVVAPNKTLPIDFKSVTSSRSRMAPPYLKSQNMGSIGMGEIIFDAAETTPGGLVKGTVYGLLIGPVAP